MLESSTDSAQDSTFRLSRTLEAPPKLIWRVWTDPDHLAQWWGPKGMDVRVVKHDLSPGGMFLYSMALPNGEVWWGRFIYGEITPPSKLSFTVSFSDPEGGVTRAPFDENWPLENYSTVTLEPHGDGKTKLHLTGVPANATKEEESAYRNAHASMTQGWGGTMDQLSDYLDKIRR